MILMMKKYRKLIVILVGFLLMTPVAQSQVDSVFWFAAPWVTPSHAGNTPVKLRISSFNTTTTVTISQPAGTYTNTITIPPNSLASVDLSSIVGTLESKPADTPLNYGIKIKADTLITVVYEILTSGNNPETYSLKGSNGLGTEFVTPFETIWPNWHMPAGDIQPKQIFCIVATENNTKVWITPRTDIVGHPAGVTYSIILNKGQTYTAQNVSQDIEQAGKSLSGSIIVANKPISVTISDDSVVGTPRTCKDIMGDQIVPVNVVGTDYIVNKGSMYSNVSEGLFVVATQNYTQVVVTDNGGTTTHMLNRGDTWHYPITDSLSFVQATKPIYVLQATGFGCELGSAILPPINCAGSAQVAFTRTNSQGFFLNILCPTSATGNFKLNGSTTLVPASAFHTVPGTGGAWSGAQIQFNTTNIPTNSSNLLINSSDFFAMGVINGGQTTGCYYHYMSSFLRRTFVEAGLDTTLCNGTSTIDLGGTVKGATTTGVWTVVSGTGTFQNATDLNTVYTPSTSDFAQGELTFVLSSTGSCNPTRDTMKVTFVQSPIVTADAGQIYCKNNIPPITISGNVQFAATGTWSGGNGGSFGNPNSLTTTYTPSQNEINADSVALYLTSAGNMFSCANDVDTLIIRFTPKPDVNAGPDIFICSDQTSVDLTGTISGATNSGTWTTSGNGAFNPGQNQLVTQYLLDPSDTTSGSIKIILTSTNNGTCLAEKDSLTVHITQQPTLVMNVQDSVCSTSTLINLDGSITNGFGAHWSTGGFGNIANQNMLNTTYSVSSVDTTNGYVDFYLTTVGVCAGQMDSVRVHFVKSPIVNAGIDQQLCNNKPVQLTGSITGPSPTGQWMSLGTGTFVPGNNLLSTVYIPSAGDKGNGGVDLILSSTNNYGCNSKDDTLHIIFKDIPDAAFSVSPVCEGENASFIDQSSISVGTISDWSWNFGNGETSSIDNPQHSFQDGGTYAVQLIVTGTNGCSDTISHNLVVHYAPDPNFTNTTACEMNTIYFTDLSTIPVGSITDWSYNFYGFGTSNNQNPQFIFPVAGDYPVTLTATSDFGCTADTTLSVNVIQSPSAHFNADPNPAIVGQEVHFKENSTGTNLVGYYWDFGDGEASSVQNPTHSFDNGGAYKVTFTVTDANNCTDTISRIVSIDLLPVLPSGFSPNGDGKNDVFIIRGGPFAAVDFKVYNNWGQLVFSSTDQKEGWDGMYKGAKSPIGVYTWTFVVKMGNGQVVKKSGDVTLIR